MATPTPKLALRVRPRNGGELQIALDLQVDPVR
jgi:hypothetical protein